MARRRHMSRGRKRSRRSYNLRKRVMPSQGTAPNGSQSFFTTSGNSNSTGLQSHTLGNIPFDDDQDRKIVGLKGRMDLSFSLSGGQATEIISAIIVSNDSVGVPSTTDYDPFQDQPGDSDWKGKPFKTLWQRYAAKALPSGATAGVIDRPIQMRAHRVVLIKPGQTPYLVFWHRASAASKSVAAAWNFGLRILQ